MDSVSEKGMSGDWETRYKTRVAKLQCSPDSKEAERTESAMVGKNLIALEDFLIWSIKKSERRTMTKAFTSGFRVELSSH